MNADKIAAELRNEIETAKGESDWIIIRPNRAATLLDAYDERGRLLAEALDLLQREHEELRLIRMKDSSAIYDPTVRVEADVLLSKLKEATDGTR